jgi:hypothetical protein
MGKPHSQDLRKRVLPARTPVGAYTAEVRPNSAVLLRRSSNCAS